MTSACTTKELRRVRRLLRCSMGSAGKTCRLRKDETCYAVCTHKSRRSWSRCRFGMPHRQSASSLSTLTIPRRSRACVRRMGPIRGSDRYRELTAEAPGLRQSLLPSGILRCADILEETRRRANRARAESLQLPIESQAHWWRHYYTADVQVQPRAADNRCLV